MRTVVLWLAGGMFAATVLLGALPLHDSAGDSCGTAFSVAPDPESPDPERSRTEAVECVQLRDQARQLPIALLVLGGALGLSQLPWSRLRYRPARLPQG